MERLADDVVAAIKRRNRLSEQIVDLTEKRRLADQEIRKKLSEDFGTARISFRYGSVLGRISDVHSDHSISPDGQIWLSEWLAQDDRFIRRLFNLRSVTRFAALREMLDTYTEGGWSEFEARYVTYTDKPASGVSFMPQHMAPKFLQKLDDLEVIVGR